MLALTTCRRFTKRVYVTLPDHNTRVILLEKLLKKHNNPLSADKLKYLARWVPSTALWCHNLAGHGAPLSERPAENSLLRGFEADLGVRPCPSWPAKCARKLICQC